MINSTPSDRPTLPPIWRMTREGYERRIVEIIEDMAAKAGPVEQAFATEIIAKFRSELISQSS